MIANNTNELTDIYCLFKTENDFQAFLKHEAQPTARFRAKDHVDYHTGSEEVLGIAKQNREYLTILTNALLDFSNNDIIYDIKYEIKWRILDYTTADDGDMKKYSMRPRKSTIINLVR